MAVLSRIQTVLITACTGLAMACEGVVGAPAEDLFAGIDPHPPDAAGPNGPPDGPGPVGGPGPGPEPPLPPWQLDISPDTLRGLSPEEYDATVFALLGETSESAVGLLPSVLPPFSHEYEVNPTSSALIEGSERLALQLAAEVMGDATKRDSILPCDVASGDASCAQSFIEQFGQRALRRPLESTEVVEFSDLFDAISTHQRGDFSVSIETTLSAFLQHPEFLYHVEIGDPVVDHPGLHRLDAWEIASRLSYFLWGTMPDDWLLGRAADGTLDSADGRRHTAVQMLDDPRGLSQIDRFHAQWLGYAVLPHGPELTGPMRQETRALIERILFVEKGSWFDLFTFDETFIDDSLAQHYDLPSPGPQADWVSLEGTERRGILSQGAFLSIEGKFDDTSPVQRGKNITERLLCRIIPEPDADAMVDVDAPPPGSGCKSDRYTIHSQGACAGCHAYMDPIGMGLENFDNQGRYRTQELEDPSCTITGEGSLPEVGDFQGPAGLAQALIDSQLLDQCLVKQLLRFASGRYDTHAEEGEILRITEAFREDGHRFDHLVGELVASDAFIHRKVAP